MNPAFFVVLLQLRYAGTGRTYSTVDVDVPQAMLETRPTATTGDQGPSDGKKLRQGALERSPIHTKLQLWWNHRRAAIFGFNYVEDVAATVDFTVVKERTVEHWCSRNSRGRKLYRSVNSNQIVDLGRKGIQDM